MIKKEQLSDYYTDSTSISSNIPSRKVSIDGDSDSDLPISTLTSKTISTSPSTSTSSKYDLDNNIFITPYLEYQDLWFKTESGLKLSDYLKKLFTIAKNNLSCNVESDSTRAIIVPHAGISHSGLCSASAYLELTNRSRPVKNIILLCTHHTPETTSPISTPISTPISPTSPISLNASSPLKHSNTSHLLKETKKMPLNIIAPAFKQITTMKPGRHIEVDTALISKIKHLVKIDKTGDAFKNEHAFFNQIPFLETVAPEAKICPLLIGNIIGNNTSFKATSVALHALIKILRDKLAKNDTILICSSDFSHVNGDFSHKITNNIFQNIRRLDSETLQFLYNIVDGNESRNKSIDNILFMQNSATCGIMAIYLFGKVLHSLATAFSSSSSSSSSDSGSESSNRNRNRIQNAAIQGVDKFLYSRVSCYYSSTTRDFINVINNFDKKTLTPLYEIKDQNNSSVSYVGLIYTKQPYIQVQKPRKIDSTLTEYEQLALLQLAREQLFYNLAGQNKIAKISANLIKPINAQVFGLSLGVFVTLLNHKDNKLRGCIGTLETDNDEFNIESNVKKYAIEAAFSDNRFSAVTIEEFNKLDITITILYGLQPISLNQYFTGKFQLGRDGILMKIGKKKGYFLPSVATDLGLKGTGGKDKLLDELCREKVAGCDTKTAFRKNNVELFYNEGLEFSF
jgi:uncharacterized protein (TIGR00296 family)/AmmeMemoRadiSam system protein B